MFNSTSTLPAVATVSYSKVKLKTYDFDTIEDMISQHREITIIKEHWFPKICFHSGVECAKNKMEIFIIDLLLKILLKCWKNGSASRM